MKCNCFNITPADLENDHTLTLKLGTRCDSCPLLSIGVVADRRVIPDRRVKKREPKGRRKSDYFIEPSPELDVKNKIQPVLDDAPDIPVRNLMKPLGPNNSFTSPIYSKLKEQEVVNVHIKLNNGDSFFAKIYINRGERMQDLLNDSRDFIPIMKKNPVGNDRVAHSDTFMVIAKKNIVSIEER